MRPIIETLGTVATTTHHPPKKTREKKEVQKNPPTVVVGGKPKVKFVPGVNVGVCGGLRPLCSKVP